MFDKNNKKLLILGGVSLGLLIIIFLIMFMGRGTCITENKTMARGLMKPMIADGTELSFDTGPECKILKKIKQNSVVSYKSPRGPDPIILKVAAMPIDKISLADDNALMINGERYLNSEGEIYRFSANEQQNIIATITEEHNGKIPNGYYFLLGDNDSIYLDSSRFGLSDGKDILGILAK